ncbi:hypothetical protein GOODEAATRI_033165 [Goodea atripinnis]|uniref:Uncharacterized protein n=1 Tax=Goodea atripinnis TaxID=208336 RepID=A0ABV0PJG5_9TELE
MTIYIVDSHQKLYSILDAHYRSVLCAQHRGSQKSEWLAVGRLVDLKDSFAEWHSTTIRPSIHAAFLENSINLTVMFFVLWEEDGVPRKNPCYMGRTWKLHAERAWYLGFLIIQREATGPSCYV